MTDNPGTPNSGQNGYKQARTPEGIERISQATLKHGGRKAERLFYGGQTLEPHYPEMWAEILADQPDLRGSLNAGGIEALDARRYVETELLRRIWVKLAVEEARSPKDLAYFDSRASVWTNHSRKESAHYQDRHLSRNDEDNIIDAAISSARGSR